MSLLSSILPTPTASLTSLTSTPSISIPVYESITSIYYSVGQDVESVTAILATETAKASMKSLSNKLEREIATLSYYSLLEIAATETNPTKASSLAPYIIQASSSVEELFKSSAFYNGNYPSLGGNAALLAIFALLLLLHLIFGLLTKQWWFMTCWLMGLILEVIGYSGRVKSHFDVLNINAFIIQLVCITLAPCFLLAGIYYLLAQLTVVMGTHFSMLKPMQYSTIFILCDLIAIIIQAIGGATAAGALSEYEDTRPGANIMVGGLAFQVFSMTLFQFFWYMFLYKCYKEYKLNDGKDFNPEYLHLRSSKYFPYLIVVISIAVILIYVRSIYRLIELCEGFSGKLATVEVYFMILEALMISLASLLLTVFYPGFVYGRKSSIVVKKGFNFSKFRKSKKNASISRSSSADTNNFESEMTGGSLHTAFEEKQVIQHS